MNNITGFTFYASYHESLKDLEEKDRKEMLIAIVDYVFEDQEPNFNGFKKTIWTLIKPNLTTSKNKSKNAKKETEPNQQKNKNKSNENQKEINDLIDKDKDKELDIDIDIDKDNNIDTTTIFTYVEKNFGRTLSPIEYEKINSWLSLYEEEVIKYAISVAIMNNKKTFNYVNGILNNWKSCGYKTLQEIKDNEVRQRPKIEIDPEKKEIFDYDWLNDPDNDLK